MPLQRDLSFRYIVCLSWFACPRTCVALTQYLLTGGVRVPTGWKAFGDRYSASFLRIFRLDLSGSGGPGPSMVQGFKQNLVFRVQGAEKGEVHRVHE